MSNNNTTNGRNDENRGVSEMPVHRNYDFEKFVPTDVPEYIPHNGEREEIEAEIDATQNGKLGRVLVGGPTGCGKTHLARIIAQDRGYPLFTIQGKYSMNEADLMGTPLLINGETVWSDGVLTKALLASRERPVVLLVDEANRARPEAKAALFSALDDRASITLDSRGGEMIQGNAQNLIVIATINEGPGYFVEKMDLAERRRFGNKWFVDYLGKTHPDREAALAAERSGCPPQLAEMLVETANDIRRRAEDPQSDIPTGIPTATVISWAQTAMAYGNVGLDNPVIRAGMNSVVNPFYASESEEAADEVREIIRSRLDGVPVDSDAIEEWVEADGSDDEDLMAGCRMCNWNLDYETYREDHRDAWLSDECPVCAEDVGYGSRPELEAKGVRFD